MMVQQTEELRAFGFSGNGGLVLVVASSPSLTIFRRDGRATQPT